MQAYKKEFLDLCLEHEAILFGEFTLKSGRISPYMYNAGKFNTGSAITKLGNCFASLIQEQNIAYDVVFGPAYKGIPLLIATIASLANQFGINKPYCFNRKLIKDYGEKGNLVGANLENKVLLIDDVITAGTTINENIDLINKHKAELSGVVLSFDRQERGVSNLTAVEEISKKAKIPVVSIANLDDLIQHIQNSTEAARYSPYLDKIVAYQQQYGKKR